MALSRSSRTILRRTLLTFTAFVVGGYLALLVYLRLNETALLYPRISVAELPRPDSELQLPFSNVSFDTEDGVRLNAWAIPASAPTDPDQAPWVLLAHGQTGNVATTVRPKYYAHLRQIGVNILAFDWRGFGASAGTPSEEGLYRDASAAYAYLRTSLGVPAERIIIYGHSLGTAPAIELATRVKAAALIIEGAPYSIRARAQEVYPLVPIRLIAKSEFNSLHRISRVQMPILVMHAADDGTIPIEHGRRLFDAANGPKRFVELRGGHGDAFEVDSSLYFGAYASFVRTLRLTPTLTSR